MTADQMRLLRAALGVANCATCKRPMTGVYVSKLQGERVALHGDCPQCGRTKSNPISIPAELIALARSQQ